jgi:hypothetical protein
MPLDTRIALGVQPIQIADPLAQYSQFAQARAAGNQNALAQYQLGSAQRADVQANALNEAYAGATDPNTGEIDYGKVRNFLAQKGAGSQIPGVIKGQAEYQKAQTEAQRAQSDLVDAKLKQSRQFLDTIDPAAPGAVNQYLAWHQANHADPVLGPILKARGVTEDQSRATIETAVAQGPQAFADLINKSKLGTEKFMEMNKPTLTSQNLGGTERILATPGLGGAAAVVPGSTGTVTEKPRELTPPSMVAEYTFAKTPDGGNFKGSYQDFVTARAAAGRAPAAPRPEQPPVAVIDPVTGKQVYVSREEALRGRMAPATALEGLAPKEIQSREAKYPQATSAVKTFETKADSLAADMEKLANSPGLSGISGIIYGRTPAVTKEARAAQALYDSIVARGGFAELQAMRASSPTGGALGNVSNQEGQYLRDAFAPINRTQDTGDLKTALTTAANATRSAKQRVRDAYDMTYEYKTGGSAAPKPSAVAPNVDALLKKYQ